MTKPFFAFLLALMMSVCAFAQDITVHGTVVSKTDGEPLIGASVRSEVLNIGVSTDIDGNFIIKVPQGTELTVSYVGFKPASFAAQPQVTIELVEDSELLDEVVVVGYQTVRKADLTGAVAVMNMKEPLSENSGNIMNSMAGKLPGVNVVPDAAPGGTGSIRVRGMSTANSSNDPLYVIDGVPTDNINCINPSDIETMQVLKDAASASIYGSRAANGVVVITTKQGKGDRMTINVNYAASAQTIAKRYDLLDATQWGEAYWAASKNSHLTPSHVLYGNGATPVLQPYLNGNANFPTANTDWQDQVYQTAWTNNLTASISNNTENVNIKAVASKDNITSINIKSGRMLLATGFLRKVFETFENYQTPIDMVTTSEVGVSVTIDNRKHLEEIVDDLKKYGTVTVDEDMVIVCVVGDLEWDNVGFEARIVQAMKDVPVRMISYGGSNYNVSLLVKATDKVKALQALSDHLFNN